MSKAVLLMGESGSGKTTSCRNLPPESTYYIDADGKGLSWRGWRDQYNAERKNYCATADAAMIRTVIEGVDNKRLEVKFIVVDCLNTIMVADEMSRAKEKGYDKWQDLAVCIWSLASTAHKYRDDLTLIFIAHTQTERDDSGYMWTRMKTSGKKLDKIVLESLFTTVLLAKCVGGKYIFETQSQFSTAKSPMGMFDGITIDNDMTIVMKALQEF